MSYANFEASRTKGEHITLYHFFYVNEEQYYYTDAEKEVELFGFPQPFIPQPIAHGNISSSGTLDKAMLEVRLPRSSGLAEAFRVYPPGEVVNVVIRQFHREDPAAEALVVWTGRVLSGGFDEDTLRLSCEPVSTSMRRTGLRRHYQIGCPHVLYGTSCRANKAAATVPDIPVIAVGGTAVTLQSGWLPAPWAAAGKTTAKFISGMMTWTYESRYGPVETKRTILRINGSDEILLSGPTTGLVTGAKVNMILGCNHQLSDCENLHANVKNYGGQPWIPQKSPFGFSNNYY